MARLKGLTPCHLPGKITQSRREIEGLMLANLQMLERYWLKDRLFIAGDQISIADLLMVTELDMLNTLVGASEVQTHLCALVPLKDAL